MTFSARAIGERGRMIGRKLRRTPEQAVNVLRLTESWQGRSAKIG
jgi:hypothetical protein